MNATGLGESGEALTERARQTTISEGKTGQPSRIASPIRILADSRLSLLPVVPTACKPGCCSCCLRLVDATLPEAIEIADHVKSTFNPSQVASLRGRVAIYRQALTQQSVPVCPFLDEGLCSIYERRPLNCRALTSPDAGLCEKWTKKEAAPPFYRDRLQLAKSISQGVGLGSKELGLPPGSCELASTVIAIYDAGPAAYMPENVQTVNQAVKYTHADLEMAMENAPPLPTFSGRGIVTSAGGQYLPSVYVAIRSLRHAGCHLPIQIWHLGPEEMPPEYIPIFTKYGAECVDSYVVREKHPFRNLYGWQNKIFSLLHSPFEQALFFDADNFALLNPEFLFDLAEFAEEGTIFWPDFATSGGEKWAVKPYAWEFLGLPPLKGEELESGQFVVNKPQCWDALNLARHMNERSDFYYDKCTYGDKDTYLLAWLVLKKPMYVVPHRPVMLPDGVVRLQHTPSGELLFQHARKWYLEREKNVHNPDFLLELEAQGWIEELRRELGV